MWVFLSARLRQWAIFAVAVPVLTVLVRTVRRRLEAKSGTTKVTRALGKVEQVGQRRKRR
ncbi:MAG: hypothetical protein JWP61_1581 [Friedmanniella sp.]|nr:hypothetical protein [Friedmanniella sp.]